MSLTGAHDDAMQMVHHIKRQSTRPAFSLVKLLL